MGKYTIITFTVLDEVILQCHCMVAIPVPSIAEESEQNFSEEDGWEFVTLADQVTSM